MWKATKKFKHGGEIYVPGDLFPEEATSKRNRRILENQRFIRYFPGEDAIPQETPATEPSEPENTPNGDENAFDPVGPSELSEMEDKFPEDEHALSTNELQEEFESRPGKKPAEISHRGSGWYDVIKDGEPVNDKPLRKADAELELVAINEAD